MFILPSISSSSEFRSVNHTLTDENSELKVSQNITFLVEISNNGQNNLLGINASKILESC